MLTSVKLTKYYQIKSIIKISPAAAGSVTRLSQYNVIRMKD